MGEVKFRHGRVVHPKSVAYNQYSVGSFLKAKVVHSKSVTSKITISLLPLYYMVSAF